MIQPGIPKEEKKTADRILSAAWIVLGLFAVIRGIIGIAEGVRYISAGSYKAGPSTPVQAIMVGLLFIIGGFYSLRAPFRKRPIKTTTANDLHAD